MPQVRQISDHRNQCVCVCVRAYVRALVKATQSRVAGLMKNWKAAESKNIFANWSIFPEFPRRELGKPHKNLQSW
jgi:hypothetical protein